MKVHRWSVALCRSHEMAYCLECGEHRDPAVVVRYIRRYGGEMGPKKIDRPTLREQTTISLVWRKS